MTEKEEEQKDSRRKPLILAVALLALTFVSLYAIADYPVSHVKVEVGCSPGLNKTIDDRTCLSTAVDRDVSFLKGVQWKFDRCPEMYRNSNTVKCRASLISLP